MATENFQKDDRGEKPTSIKASEDRPELLGAGGRSEYAAELKARMDADLNRWVGIFRSVATTAPSGAIKDQLIEALEELEEAYKHAKSD